jgi:hypothetical protein
VIELGVVGYAGWVTGAKCARVKGRVVFRVFNIADEIDGYTGPLRVVTIVANIVLVVN